MGMLFLNTGKVFLKVHLIVHSLKIDTKIELFTENVHCPSHLFVYSVQFVYVYNLYTCTVYDSIYTNRIRYFNDNTLVTYHNHLTTYCVKQHPPE